jgi:FecR protein
MGRGVSSMANLRKNTLAIVAVMLVAVASAQATSHVRIVRLSYEDGSVQMSRATGQRLERAILNSPIVEGSSVVTGTDGLAEVEFENNSSVRLGQATDVRFRQLLINDAGEMINEVELVRGTMYFDTRVGKNNIYRVVAADRTFVVPRKSEVRFMMNGDDVEVSVLNGEAQLVSKNAEIVKIKKNDTLTSDAGNSAGFTVAKGFDSIPLDRWNNERGAYQTVYSYNNTGYGSYGVPGSLGGYGFQDLAYYGGFMSLPGYGTVWQPYGVSNWMGWNPYLSGAWAYTPGFGYAWASAYPWGWLPYHYGAWGFSPGVGWFWAPGNTTGGGGIVTNWQPNAPVVKGPPGYSAPVPPVVPTNGSRPSIMVGRIGQTPAYIPGGPVPPNFASVIDHSRINGLTASTGGATGGGGGGGVTSARNSRAANMRGSSTASGASSTFAAPGTGSSAASSSQSGNNRSGHVFAMPAQSASQGSVAPWTPGLGMGQTSSQGSAAPMHSSGAVSHATGASGGSHSSNPK